MKTLSNILTILSIKTSNRNPAIISQKNKALFLQFSDLLSIDPSKRKHPLLLNNMLPL